MAIQLKPQNAGGLEGRIDGKDALKWIHTAKVVLNGGLIEVPIPDGSRYVLIESIKPVPDGYRYNVVFFNGPADPNGYLEFGTGKVGIQPNKIYRLPPDVSVLHLGTE